MAEGVGHAGAADAVLAGQDAALIDVARRGGQTRVHDRDDHAFAGEAASPRLLHADRLQIPLQSGKGIVGDALHAVGNVALFDVDELIVGGRVGRQNGQAEERNEQAQDHQQGKTLAEGVFHILSPCFL